VDQRWSQSIVVGAVDEATSVWNVTAHNLSARSSPLRFVLNLVCINSPNTLHSDQAGLRRPVQIQELLRVVVPTGYREIVLCVVWCWQ
jgi:hypothetical protein